MNKKENVWETMRSSSLKGKRKQYFVFDDRYNCKISLCIKSRLPGTKWDLKEFVNTARFKTTFVDWEWKNSKNIYIKKTFMIFFVVLLFFPISLLFYLRFVVLWVRLTLKSQNQRF